MLSIIIPWYNRQELHGAISSIVTAAEKLKGEVTIVNLGGDIEMLYQQLGKHLEMVNIITLPKQAMFNKPLAQNIGAYKAKFQYMFFCDCDIILTYDCLPALFDKINNKLDNFGTLEGVIETELNSRKAKNIVRFGYELHLKTANGSEIKIIDNEEDAQKGTRQAPGLLLVRKSDFEKVNGYNSQLDGWGWEDQDMICRLTLGANLNRVHSGIAQHISHDDQSRMKGYLNYSDRWESRDKMFRRALANYDDANFLGTYKHDIEKYKDLIL